MSFPAFPVSGRLALGLLAGMLTAPGLAQLTTSELSATFDASGQVTRIDVGDRTLGGVGLIRSDLRISEWTEFTWTSDFSSPHAATFTTSWDGVLVTRTYTVLTALPVIQVSLTLHNLADSSRAVSGFEAVDLHAGLPGATLWGGQLADSFYQHHVQADGWTATLGALTGTEWLAPELGFSLDLGAGEVRQLDYLQAYASDPWASLEAFGTAYGMQFGVSLPGVTALPSAFTAVPEPGAYGLVGMGLLAAIIALRRRRLAR